MKILLQTRSLALSLLDSNLTCNCLTIWMSSRLGSWADRGSSQVGHCFVCMPVRLHTLVSNFHVMNNAPKQEELPAINGAYPNGTHDPSLIELENELPQVNDEMVPFGELLSRVVQSIYAELTEMAETYVHTPSGLVSYQLSVPSEKAA